MEKLIYIAPNPIHFQNYDGVSKKIMYQYNIFNKNYDTYVLGYYKNDIAYYHNNDIKIISNRHSNKHRRYKLFECAYKFIKENDIKLCYIRYGYSDYSFIKMIKNIKEKCDAKIIIEIPTYPYDVEMNKNLRFRILRILDKINRKKIKNYVDKIATFSQDTEIFGIKCINIFNGVPIEEIKLKQFSNELDIINIIAVASMGIHHGYDRIIRGLKNYYQNNGKRTINLHIVGEGQAINEYKTLIKKYSLENNIKLHGFKSGEELESIYRICDISVASLGLHRINIYLASTLKTREYGAKGLPIITSCKIDIYPEDYKYILNFPEDDSDIDIYKIIKFYDEIYKGKVSKRQIAEEIREYTKSKCDMSIAMKPIIDFFAINLKKLD